MYPKYALQLRHHVFSFLVAVSTFIVYCFFSTVSTTISGIEYTLNSVKSMVVEKGDVLDALTSLLLSDNNQSKFVHEVNSSVLEAVSVNKKFNNYIKDIDLSQIKTEGITTILSANNLSVKEKAIQIVDKLFDIYLKEFTSTLKRIWWVLLISLIIIQFMYWGAMVYRAEKKSVVKSMNISDFINTGMY